MKKLVIIAVVLVASLYACGAGVMQKDRNGNIFPDVAPLAFGTASSTKANITLSTSTYARVRLQPSAAVTVTVNGAGASWPIAANAIQTYHIPTATTSLVFAVTSSATKTKLYYQSE